MTWPTVLKIVLMGPRERSVYRGPVVPIPNLACLVDVSTLFNKNFSKSCGLTLARPTGSGIGPTGLLYTSERQRDLAYQAFYFESHGTNTQLQFISLFTCFA